MSAPATDGATFARLDAGPSAVDAEARDSCLEVTGEFYGFACRADRHADLDALAAGGPAIPMHRRAAARSRPCATPTAHGSARPGCIAPGHATLHPHADSDVEAALGFWRRRGYREFGTLELSTHLDKPIAR